uniref:Ribosomal RNA-processing protein 17 n=2 Tax=Triticum urartu TaxID=4572 RepID=A0A8R7Q6D4_TRIUA
MEASEVEGEDVVVGQMPTFMVPKHINKRALKNKALSISLDNKALKDFVTGFHKRKKKRRKEAQRITQEKDRRKRIEARKKRKQEKEIALYDKVVSSKNADGQDGDGDGDEMDAAAPEINTYEDGGTRITVVTSEITHGEEDDQKPVSRSYAKKICGVVSAKKQPSLGVKKKPPSKRQFGKSKKTKKVNMSRRKNKGKH